MDFLYLKALIQGIVEGITEFLPVSSTGHMILLDETVLKMDEDFTRVFEIVIQLGAILSVLVYFRKKVFDGVFITRSGKFGIDFGTPGWRLWLKVLPALLPALVLGALFGGWIQDKLFNPVTVAVMLVLGGIALILVDRPAQSKKDAVRIGSIDQLSYKRAFGIGLAQCVAMIPGTSRSAATIVGGMGLGCSRELAAEFSFFLAIPTMFAASAYSMLKSGLDLECTQWIALGIGFVTAFFVAWAVIAVFMRFIKNHDFRGFGYYRIVLGIAVLLYFWLK